MVLIGISTLLFWGSLFAFGRELQGYSHTDQPVGLLGADGFDNAFAFNMLGLVLPGVVLACVAWRWRQSIADSDHWSIRIGTWLAVLSALAFAAQGLFCLDPRDLDATQSRLHAAAWTVWWVAFVPAALLLAHGLQRLPRRHALAWTSAGVALLVGWLALSPPEMGAPGITQRVMLALWFGWWWLLAGKAWH